MSDVVIDNGGVSIFYDGCMLGGKQEAKVLLFPTLSLALCKFIRYDACVYSAR